MNKQNQFHFMKSGEKRAWFNFCGAGRTASVRRNAFRFQAIRALVLNRRQNIGDRFQNPLDWIRLFMLGIVIVDLAILTIHKSIFGNAILNYSAGMPAVFGGLFLAIMIIKLGRPKLYLDWIAVGCLHTVAGVLLGNDAWLSTPVTHAGFFVALFSSAALTASIGVTLNPSNGDSGWITAAGLTGFFCAFWVLVRLWFDLAISPDIILAADLLLLGVGIAGFGFSLRKKGADVER